MGSGTGKYNSSDAATSAVPPNYKAHKWLITRGDLELHGPLDPLRRTSLARIEVIGARLLADREVIPQAMTLNPGFFKVVYSDLLNAKKTPKAVRSPWTPLTTTWRSALRRCSLR